MFGKLCSNIVKCARRIRKSVRHTFVKIKDVVKSACQCVMTTPVLAFAVSTAITAAAAFVCFKFGAFKLLKSVIVSGVTFVSGITCIAWRNKVNAEYTEEMTEYCNTLKAEEA